MGERLGQLDLFGPVAWPLAMTNADESFHLSAHQRGDRQELPGSRRAEIIAERVGHARISFYIFNSKWNSGKKQFWKSRIILPRQTILNKRMLQLNRGEVGAVSASAEEDRISRFVPQPEDNTLRV